MSKKHHAKTQPANRVNSYENVIAPQGSAETPVTKERSSFENDFIPSQEEVRLMAYRLYEQRGGTEIDNWLEAERQLREEYRKGA